MSQKTGITVAYGDGIGPEIMEASLHIIRSAGAAVEIEKIDIGENVYLSGNTAGIEPSAWESLRRTKVFYNAPITTPQGRGFKSLNVTARKKLGLYGGTVTQAQVIGLMQKVAAAGYDIVKTETLRNFDGQRGYTLAQGQ